MIGGDKQKRRMEKPSAFVRQIELLGKAGVNQVYQTLYRVGLVRAVSKDLDGGAADDTKGKNAEERLSVDLSLVLLYPDGRLVLVRLLDEESCERT